MASGSGSRVRLQVSFAPVPEWLLYADVPGDDGELVPISAQAIRMYAILCRLGKGGPVKRFSQSEISEHARCSSSTIRRSQAELVAAGAIRVTAHVDGRGRHENDYEVLAVRDAAVQSSLLDAPDLDRSPVSDGVATGDTPSVDGALTHERAGSLAGGQAGSITGERSRSSTGEQTDNQARDRDETSPSAKSPRVEHPTNDTIYLAEQINERWSAKSGSLTPAAMQRFVVRFGAAATEDAVRELHGFPPADAVRSPYAYLEAILTERLASLDDQREDRDAAAELTAHARVALDAAAVGPEEQAVPA